MALMHMKNSREDYLAQRVDELRAELLRRDPPVLATNTGAELTGSNFNLLMWRKSIVLNSQDFIGRELDSGQPVDIMTQALLAYYFYTADGTLPSAKWIAFSGLPDGQFYAAAFQGYTGNELAKGFGNDSELFKQSAGELGGQPYDLGDAAFIFQALPLVPILAVQWLGDEDFAPSYRLLFDYQVSHHLPTDACAILGSTLTRRLLRSSQHEIDSKEYPL